MINVTSEELAEGRRLYTEFMRGISGGFYRSLFESIARAKAENLYKMAKGFPGETFAYLEYTGMLNKLHWTIDGELYMPEINSEWP